MKILIIGLNERLIDSLARISANTEAHIFWTGKLPKDSSVFDYDLIISAHCKDIFPKELVQKVRCINIHPGYLPEGRGYYPQVWSILCGKKAGATIHLMNEKIDAGPIICRKEVSVWPWDTSKSVYDKVIDAEIELLEEFWGDIVKEDYAVTDNDVEAGSYKSLKDFENLCEFNDAQTTIKHLRALSHPPHWNAYYYDEDSGERIYIRVECKRASEILADKVSEDLGKTGE